MPSLLADGFPQNAASQHPRLVLGLETFDQYHRLSLNPSNMCHYVPPRHPFHPLQGTHLHHLRHLSLCQYGENHHHDPNHQPWHLGWVNPTHVDRKNIPWGDCGGLPVSHDVAADVLDLVVAIEAIVETDGILVTLWPWLCFFDGCFSYLQLSDEWFISAHLKNMNRSVASTFNMSVVHFSPLTSAPPWAWNHRSQCPQARLPLGDRWLVILGDSFRSFQFFG